ncbi:lipocalin family protein [Palleronia sp.]|uniref:lipocalin family protein n=1 Tax=Palleronia sp. TaxID=1940284 RepID=UPI0035C7CF5F
MGHARFLALVPLVFAACSTDRPQVTPPGYRDSGAMISSIASFDPARFAGEWHLVASFPTQAQDGCTDNRVAYFPTAEDLRIVNTCTRNGEVARTQSLARMTGPGRFDVQPGPEPYWVLWVDEGYRTAVIGTPSGQMGWILNRNPVIPADRLAAAREILDFNGYDVSRLRMIP